MLNRLYSVFVRLIATYVSEAELRLLTKFGMFGVVGLLGFVIDTATVYALRYAVGLYVAGLVAYFTASTGNWICNRLWTFRDSDRTDAWYVQWGLFVTANLGGFVLNRGIYFLLITFWEFAAHNPVIAVFAGAVAGMTINFKLSQKVVFR